MKLMKLLCSIIPLLMLTVIANAQQENTFSKDGDSDPAALAMLDKMEKKIQGYPALKATFSMEITIPGNPPETFDGAVVQQGNAYFVNFPGYEIFTDGKTRWVYQENINEVQIYRVSEDTDGFATPMDYLKLAGSDAYVCAIAGNAQQSGKALTAIEFKPLDNTAEYSKLRLLVNTATNLPDELTLFGKDASRTVLRVTDFKPAETQDISAFRFDASKYPGIHVEDLRID